MSLIAEFASQIVSLALRLVFGLFALVFALSLLVAGVIAVFFMLLRSLLTGRRPAPFVVWQRYREASKASAERWTRRAPGAPRGAVRPTADDVTDVTPRDVTPR